MPKSKTKQAAYDKVGKLVAHVAHQIDVLKKNEKKQKNK